MGRLQNAFGAASLAAAVAFAPCAAAQVQQMPKDAAWSLRLPKDEKVAYRGVVSYDGANTGAFPGLYPAPNLAGLFAAIATHAVMADSAQSSQKRQIQEAADKVLVPYQPVLSGYQNKELMQAGLAKVSAGSGGTLVGAADKPAGWVVESTPIFSMTQDQRAIILDNAIAVYAPGAATAAQQTVVRIVSHPRSGEDLEKVWLANEGRALKDESASLLASSLNIALVQAMGGAGESAAQRTFRYSEGGAERMERAQLVSEDCDRLLIKNLRGWLMSIPARQPADQCKGAAESGKP